MGRLGHTLSTLRPVGRPTRTQDSLPAAGQALPGGLSGPLGSSERFRAVCYISPPFPGFPWRKRASVRHPSVDKTHGASLSDSSRDRRQGACFPAAANSRSPVARAVTVPARTGPGRLVAATGAGGSSPREQITTPGGEGYFMTSLQAVRARFARNEGLPFADVLTEASVLDVLREHGVTYRDRVFNPVATIWGFLGQVLSDDHGCRDAVSRVVAHRAASGLAACSPNAASYCNARARLPAGVLRSLARRTAEQLQAGLPDGWKWNGRSAFVADGSHVSMPDTPANQASYPQPPQQQPGIGFPLARLAVLLSLASGACHDLALAPYAGKGTGETTRLRQMYGSLRPGDVVAADALFDNCFLAVELRRRGVELVARVQAERVGSRTVESRPDGDVIVWRRPNKPRGMTGEQYRGYPETLLMRQVSVDAREKNNRVGQFKVITTILDASIDGGQIGELYERRWQGEIYQADCRSSGRLYLGGVAA